MERTEQPYNELLYASATAGALDLAIYEIAKSSSVFVATPSGVPRRV
jgi:hypothetical protein